MLETTSQTLQCLKQTLEAEQRDYKIIQKDCDQSVEFIFTGRLSNQPVIWNTRLSTLESIASSQHKSRLRQFIHIQQIDNIYQANIGLYLKQIDLAAIKRTIIMIRNYKKLRLGRHIYGPEYTFTD